MSKLIYKKTTLPPQKQGQLQRHRLDMLIEKAIEHSLVLVNAGTGYGKTQAVSMFLNNKNKYVIWLQLSIIDNHPTRFWEGLVYALHFQNEETAKRIDQLGFPQSLDEFNRFLHLFAVEVYAGEQFVFVLDDFHLIENEQILQFVERLIFARLENFCMILISRQKPDLDLNAMITNGLVSEITLDDLKFTHEETEAFFKMMDTALTKKELETVQTYTDGWSMALYLACLFIKKGNVASDNPVVGAMPSIFDMIERELYSDYTPQIKKFLIKISLLKDFPMALIRELAGDYLEDVLQLINNNMFIYYNLHTKYCSFHQLFLEFLNEKQISLTEQEIANTYLKAADWCLTHGKKIDALLYYDRCSRYDQIWDIILHYGAGTFSKAKADFFIDLINKFPEEFIKKNPMTRVIRAGFLMSNACICDAKKELLEIQKELESLPSTQENKIVLGEICCMLGLISIKKGCYDFPDLFQKACIYLPNGSYIINNASKSINTQYAIALNRPNPGEIEKLKSALFHGIPYASKAMNGYAHGLDYLAAAEAAFLTGNIKSATKYAYEAVYRSREKQVSDIASSGYFLLMRIEAIRGDYNAVVSHLEELRSYVESLEEKQSFNGLLDIAEGWFYVTVGQMTDVAAWIMDDTLNKHILSPYSRGREYLVKAGCLLKRGEYDRLLAWMREFEEWARKNNMWLFLADTLIFKAISYHNIRDKARSITALQEAYEITHGNGLIMQFMELGKSMRTTIEAVRESKEHHIPREWLDNIYAKASTYAKRAAFITAEYNKKNRLGDTTDISLTKREREILSGIYQGLTREEIAESLYISVSTVKSNLNRIYRKLDAINSVDAIRIALNMELI